MRGKLKFFEILKKKFLISKICKVLCMFRSFYHTNNFVLYLWSTLHLCFQNCWEKGGMRGLFAVLWVALYNPIFHPPTPHFLLPPPLYSPFPPFPPLTPFCSPLFQLYESASLFISFLPPPPSYQQKCSITDNVLKIDFYSQ